MMGFIVKICYQKGNQEQIIVNTDWNTDKSDGKYVATIQEPW